MEASPHTFRFFCTFCGQQIVADPIVAGTKVECPHCAGSFHAPKRIRKRRRRSSSNGEDSSVIEGSVNATRWPDIHEAFAEEETASDRSKGKLAVSSDLDESEAENEVSLLPPSMTGLPWKFWAMAGTLVAAVLSAIVYVFLYQDNTAMETAKFIDRTREAKIAARRVWAERGANPSIEELRAAVRDFVVEIREEDAAAGDGTAANEAALPEIEAVEETEESEEPTLFPEARRVSAPARVPAAVRPEVVSAPASPPPSEGPLLQLFPRKVF